jgi:hypothetical protein
VVPLIQRRPAPRYRAAGLLLLCAALAALAGCTPAPPAGGTLQITARAASGDFTQVFWDEGGGFTEARSQRVALAPAPERFQTLRFTIPQGNIRGVRLDPFNGAGTFDIASVEVLDRSGAVVRRLDPGSLVPVLGVASITRDDAAVHFAMDPGATDPSLFIAPACLAAPAAPWSLGAVTPLSLAVAALLCLTLIGAAVWYTVVPDGLPSRAAIRASWRSYALNGLWLAVLFLIVVTAKWWLIQTHPSQVPYVDQWNAEAGALYVPWQDRCLPWRQMLAAHNEHRIFFTRMLALGLFVLNRQWDPQLQQVVNAGLHALTAVALALFAWRLSGRRRLDAIVACAALLFALPFNWENTLAGFQSAFYFTVLFAVLAFGLTLRPGFTPGWAAGWACAAAGLLSSAGGILTPVALGVSTAVRAAGGRIRWRLAGVEAALALVLFGTGLALRRVEPGHAALAAGSAAQFVTAFLRNLAWPWIDEPAIAVLLWLPWLGLAVRVAARRSRRTEHAAFLGAVGAWVIVQAAALAYGRGAGGEPPASRYMDLLSLGCFANALALLPLASGRAPGRKRIAAWAAVAAWLIVVGVGLDRLTADMWRGAEVRRTWMAAYTQTVRDFLRTDDLPALSARRFPFETPYPDPVLLGNAWLRNPAIRRILPDGIREPIHLVAQEGDDVFAEPGWYPATPPPPREARGSYIGPGNPTQGRFVSRPVTCVTGGLLSFAVAGYLGVPGTSLALSDGAATRPVNPDGLPRERWVRELARCPDRSFAIVATDATPEYWFAFSDPVEVGVLSAVAEALLRHALALFVASLALGVLAARLS